MCDEVSLVMAAAADGASDTPSLFETQGCLASGRAVGFAPEHGEALAGGCVWLRYRVRAAGLQPPAQTARPERLLLPGAPGRTSQPSRPSIYPWGRAAAQRFVRPVYRRGGTPSSRT